MRTTIDTTFFRNFSAVSVRRGNRFVVLSFYEGEWGIRYGDLLNNESHRYSSGAEAATEFRRLTKELK